jgi:predicted Zn-dependent protease
LVSPLLAGPAPSSDLAAEDERARATAQTIEREWPIAPTGPVTRFVRSVGDRLARSAAPSPFPWRFTVIRNRAANAFSIGGGRIYVNEGTPFVCEDEAELAAILAHEMGHELAGHFRSAYADDASGGWPGGILGAQRSADGGRQIGSVHQQLDPAREREADRISIEILQHAGYDPHAALSVATRLARAAPGRHPSGAPRLQALADLLEGVPATGQRSSEAFRRLKEDTEPGTE